MLVNTCGFIEAAKQESVDELLDAAGSGAKVVAAGCLAERYGSELAAELPEAQVLSFDDYADIGARLDSVLAGERRPAHEPRDRRRLLPISPAARAADPGHQPPGHGISDLPAGLAPASGPRTLRRRLSGGPVAPLKIASGCDRRCSFCAIPAFRGAFLSRPPEDLVAEAGWLAGHGVRELVLVSENSTSYGKDLGNPRLLDELLPALAAVPGIDRIRVSYLQPAEVRPALIEVMAATAGGGPVLRSVLPARQRAGAPRPCAASATASGSCAARPGQAGLPGGRGAVQLHRRLPRRDRRRRRGAAAIPVRGAAGRGRCLRLLRRGRHRGRHAWTGSSIRPRSPGGSRSWRTWPTS